MPISNIDAAFSSTTFNECYVFVKDKFVILNYAPGKQKREIVSGPKKIVDRFPMFKNTRFEHQIDCAFETTNNEAFFFSGDQCIRTTAPQSTNARLVSSSSPITEIFPCLIGTGFENGINASMKDYNKSYVILFKGDERIRLNLLTFEFENQWKNKISKVYRVFTGTVFESGIDAAFNGHQNNDVYIFKGQYFARFDVQSHQFINGSIRRIDEEWPALEGILL